MSKVKKASKRIAIDIAGYTLLIMSGLVGWLPGPGGIPLFLGGLGLLSINNSWAKRLLVYSKTKGESFADIFFPNKPVFNWGYDIVGLVFFSSGIILLLRTNSRIVSLAATMMMAASFWVLIMNRGRLKKLSALLYSKKNR